MAVATTTALIIAGLSAGGAIGSAAISSRAAGKASEQQQQGVREARAYGEPLYTRAQEIAAQQHAAGQAGLAPYAQQGTQGLTALSSLLGFPSAGASAPAAAAPTAAIPAQSTMAPGLGTLTTKQLADANAATGGALIGQTGGAFLRGNPPATQSSYVTLRAPTGQTRAVPADQVDFYLARGATRM